MGSKPTLAQVLRRTDPEVTQKDLAEMTGLDPSTICRLCARENRPTFETALLIADALKVPADSIDWSKAPTNGKVT